MLRRVHGYTNEVMQAHNMVNIVSCLSSIAMVASVGFGLWTFGCPVAAKVSARFGSRVAIFGGGLISALGLLGSSFAQKLFVLYVSFGVMLGIACSLVYMAAFQIVPLYFDKHRDIATALLSLGPSAGVLVMSPVVQTLLEHFDWRKTLLVLACINLLSSILGCSITRKTIPTMSNNEDRLVSPHESSEAVGCCRILQSLDFSMFKDPVFVILSLGTTLAILGLGIPIVHLVSTAVFSLLAIPALSYYCRRNFKAESN